MTAPALILTTEGTADARVQQIAHSLRHQMQTMRPELSIHLAFSDDVAPTGVQVINALARQRADEAVVVPLDLVNVAETSQLTVDMVESMRNAQPRIKTALARPIGPVAELLNMLDQRLRAALAACRCVELDGLVLAVPTVGDTRGHALMARRARQWSSHHKLPVALAYADGTGQSLSSAFASLHEQGRRKIAVSPMFLAADAEYQTILDAAWANKAVGAGAPIGPDPALIPLVMARYAFASMGLLDDFSDIDELSDESDDVNVNEGPELRLVAQA